MSKDTVETPNSDGEQESESAEQSHLERRAAELRETGLFKNSKPEVEEEVEEPKDEAQPEEEEPKAEEEPEKEPAEEEETTEETQEIDEAEAEIVLSNIDYENLDKDQVNELGRVIADLIPSGMIGDLAKGIGSKGGQENAKLRKDLREEKEKTKQLEEGLDRVSPNVNLFSDITDEKDLDQLEADLIHNHDRYSDVAIDGEWETNDLGDEGVIDNGTFYTKKAVLDFLKDARGKIRAIPARRAQLGKRKLVSKARDKVAKGLSEHFEWFGDKESPESKSYTELIGDASIASAIHLFPDIEPVLMNAFANSVGAPSRKKITMPLRNKPKPLGGGDNGSGGSGRKKSKGLQEAQDRLKGGMGSASDYATANSERFKKFFNKT
jgi:hypothetical protein